jgi:hypothetical protein
MKEVSMFSRHYAGFPILAAAALTLSAGCAGGGAAVTTPRSVLTQVQSSAGSPNMIAVSGTVNNDVAVYDPSGRT